MSRTNLLLEQDEAPASVCCAPGVPVMSPQAAQDSAALLRAVADPIRLQLLSLIANSPEQEACVCDMTGVVGVSQPTVSHHLKLLVEAGVLTRERRASWAWFTLVPERLDAIAGILKTGP